MLASSHRQELTTLEQLRPIDLPPLPERPLVSVLIGNYNYARYIGDAIESVLAQTFQHLEICFCDDGSSDDSVSVIKRYAARDPRIRFTVQNNAGHGAALNSAWSLARGDVIALLDADDAWLPSKIQIVIDLLQSTPNAGLAVHHLTRAQSNLAEIRVRARRPLESGWLAPKLLLGRKPNLPPCSALTMRREIAQKVFPIDNSFRSLADMVVRERAALLTVTVATQAALGLQRLHGRNLTGQSRLSDLGTLDNFLSFCDRNWNDRRSFVGQYHGVDIAQSWWATDEVAELRLTRAFLTQATPEEPWFARTGSWRRGVAWRVLFLLPRRFATFLVNLRWRESTLRNILKLSIGV